MRRLVAPLALAASLSLGACADMTPTQQRTLTGGAAGAAGGAAIGALAGNAALGAAIGGGAGALGGFIYDRHERSREAAFQQGVREGSRR